MSDLVPHAEIRERGILARVDLLGMEGDVVERDKAAVLIANGRDPFGFPILTLLTAQTGEPALEAREQVIAAAASALIAEQK